MSALYAKIYVILRIKIVEVLPLFDISISDVQMTQLI